MVQLEQKLIAAFDKVYDKIESGYTKGSTAIGKAYVDIKPKVILYTKVLVLAEIIIFPVMILSFLVNIPVLGTLLGAIAGILYLIMWKIPDFVLSTTGNVTKSIPLLGKPINALAEGLRSVIKPLLDIAFVISFIGLFGTIYNMTGYNTVMLIIALAAVVFFVAYAWRGGNVTFPWRGVMVIIVVVGLVYQGLFLIFPYRINKITFGVAEFVRGSDNYYEIPAGTNLYSDDFDVIRTTDSVLLVKEVDTHLDKESNEKFYEVILPNKNKGYFGGERVLVEARVTKEVQEKREEAPVVNLQVVNNQETRPRVTEQWVEFPANDQVTVPIKMEVGDEVEYIAPTAKFQTLGSKQWHTINGYAIHDCTGSNPATIKGCGKSGKVLVRVTKKG
jgi:hypothetical protein